jgi:hypothetical protein
MAVVRLLLKEEFLNSLSHRVEYEDFSATISEAGNQSSSVGDFTVDGRLSLNISENIRHDVVPIS